jgi:hypothetical protein
VHEACLAVNRYGWRSCIDNGHNKVHLIKVAGPIPHTKRDGELCPRRGARVHIVLEKEQDAVR